jgi:RNA polymerase sigma-70 factor (ECF subfamily)
MPDKPDDILLKEYLGSGNLEILGTLYSRYMALVYGVCLKYFREREISQDAVIDIFEKIISELEKHRIDNFKNWLYVVTKNYCLMRLRSMKKETEMIKHLADDNISFMENSPELHPIDKEDEKNDKALEDCIEGLKKEQRQCIQYFYYENKSYREIAGLTGMDENKIKSHLQNGKRNLKICLEESYGKEE